MKKIIFILLATFLCFVGCSKSVEDNIEPSESYSPIGVILTKGNWKNNETFEMYVYPPYIGTNKTTLPDHYNRNIKSIEYYVDGKSVGGSSISPFSISYTPNLPIGTHSLSMKLNLIDKNVIWETLTSSFTITD